MSKQLFDTTVGFFGKFGGQFVAETLIAPIRELDEAYKKYQSDSDFLKEYQWLAKSYGGRTTPLTYAENLTEALSGAKIYLKREDLNHTGSHKFNNVLGQGLLAKRMGKTRLIAETGAGQHGVATATIAAKLQMKCTVYMGAKDCERQQPNVQRMKLLGAEVVPVNHGARVLKDAINEAMRDWVGSMEESHYLLGSALGPHPYPTMVRDFQSIIGREVIEQIHEVEGRDPDCLVACVGGGSNAIGLFHPFIDRPDVRMVGVEAGGHGDLVGEHAARFSGGRDGVFHGTFTKLLQTDSGQIAETNSVSAGLDYPGVGPEHSFLQDIGRAEYSKASDVQAIRAFETLSKIEGIIPAFESSHALAWVIENAGEFSKDKIIVCNLSGRGDKDLPQYFSMERN